MGQQGVVLCSKRTSNGVGGVKRVRQKHEPASQNVSGVVGSRILYWLRIQVYSCLVQSSFRTECKLRHIKYHLKKWLVLEVRERRRYFNTKNPHDKFIFNSDCCIKLPSCLIGFFRPLFQNRLQKLISK